LNRAAIADILVRIVDRRRERLAEARSRLDTPPQLTTAPPLTGAVNSFLNAFAHRRYRRTVIAEVKMGSPSLGSLVDRFDPVELAKIYAEHGATALSVVVEPDFFHGSYELLAACQSASGLPAIAKDFIVDDLQLVWAREAGASAILLIAALYSREDLIAYAGKARSLGLVPLIETHDLADTNKLMGETWELAGVNNRNLRDFSIDLTTSRALLPSLPSRAVKVSESGFKSSADMDSLAALGYSAFLIGEALVTAEDPAAKLRELRG
jgi:indole-3-glycerol phosphate synthase